jgi:hypothetical protein
MGRKVLDGGMFLFYNFFPCRLVLNPSFLLSRSLSDHPILALPG